MIVLTTIAAGGIGAVGRYLTGGWVQARSGRFPGGTLAVNLLGALAVGLAAGSMQPGSVTHASIVGFLGGFTTFSTWAFESLSLLSSGQHRRALVNIVLPLAAGLALCAIGFYLTD